MQHKRSSEVEVRVIKDDGTIENVTVEAPEGATIGEISDLARKKLDKEEEPKECYCLVAVPSIEDAMRLAESCGLKEFKIFDAELDDDNRFNIINEISVSSREKRRRKINE